MVNGSEDLDYLKLISGRGTNREDELTKTISVNGLEREIYRLQDIGAAPNIAYLPDLHVSTSTLNNVIYKKAEENKGYTRMYVVISDVDDKTSKRIEYFQEKGLVDENQAEVMLIANKLEQNYGHEIADSFANITTIDQRGGIDIYLNQLEYHGIPINDRDALKKNYEKHVQRAKEENLEDKIKTAYETLTSEEHQQFTINNLKNKAFNYGCTKANMIKLSKVADDYNLAVQKGEIDGPELVLIKGAGNHDSEDSYQTLADTTKYTRVHHINNIGGAISLGKGDDAINFQLASNCYSSTPIGDSFGLTKKEVSFKTSPHTFDFTLIQGFDPKNKDQISDEVKKLSLEYQRLTFGEEDTQVLDFMMYHQEMGDSVPGYEHLSKRETHMTNLGLVIHSESLVKKNQDGLRRTYAGHFHSSLEDYIDDEWSQIRNRFDAVSISKNGHEKIDAGKHDQVTYDDQTVLNYAQIKFKELVELYNKQILESKAANDDISEDAKAA